MVLGSRFGSRLGLGSVMVVDWVLSDCLADCTLYRCRGVGDARASRCHVTICVAHVFKVRMPQDTFGLNSLVNPFICSFKWLLANVVHFYSRCLHRRISMIATTRTTPHSIPKLINSPLTTPKRPTSPAPSP